jgi:Xaa-Pro aminopeptidase
MKRGWDAASHEDLLLCLIDHCKPTKAIVTDIAEQMRAKGYTYSYDAIKYASMRAAFSHYSQTSCY